MVCPIFLLRRLLRDSDLEDIFAIASVMMTLAFDHFIVQLKGQARPGHPYAVNVYWYQQPLVLDLNIEKLSGCFVHQACHRKASKLGTRLYFLCDDVSQ